MAEGICRKTSSLRVTDYAAMISLPNYSSRIPITFVVASQAVARVCPALSLYLLALTIVGLLTAMISLHVGDLRYIAQLTHIRDVLCRYI